MNVFVDTGAFLAVLDAGDTNHAQAKAIWERTVGAGTGLICHNYILVETSAVLLRRLGMEAVRLFEQDIAPALHLIWVTREIHESAASAHILAARRTLSLVDCISFEIMRRTGIRSAFAFDRHFREYGYELLPSQSVT